MLTQRLGENRLRNFVDWNKHISLLIEKTLDRWVPRKRGWDQFVYQHVPNLLTSGLRVLDVGGGKRPQIDLQKKNALGLTVVGADIDADELNQAPDGSYDELIVGDIASTKIAGEFDLIFSCAVLEHVEDPRAAICNMAGALAKDGSMSHFVPTRNALYATFNRILGPDLSRRLLFAIHPDKQVSQGFPSYYKDCLPTKFTRFFTEAGLEDIRLEVQYASDYATFFFPLYLAEAVRQILVKWARLVDFSETFIITGRKF